MIRKSNKQPNLIFCSDFGLREKDANPVCRLDDIWDTQWKKVDFIKNLQFIHNCPVVHAGDLFDYWKASPMLLSETMKHLPEQFFTCYGNHDLPQHNMELFYKSGVHTLKVSGVLSVMPECHWQMFPDKGSSTLYNLLVWHVMTYQKKKQWMAESGMSGLRILKKYPQFDLIVTGHNHQAFVEEYKGRLLVNPGSLMRENADQMNFKPRVYLWYAETNTVEPVYIPIEDNVISRTHLDLKEKRDSRIDSFVSKLDGDWAAGMSFEDNLQTFEDNNKIDSDVMKIVYKATEKIKK